MTIVVTGAGGQLGRALALTCPERLSDGVAWLDRRALDVTDAAAVAADDRLARASVVLNCAAYTAVDAAEDEPGRTRAHRVNAVAPGLLARRCAQTGAHLVHVSTDYVFGSRPPAAPGSGALADAASGSGPLADAASGPDARRGLMPGDPTDPDSVYGETKLAGERAVAAAGCRATVARTAWVFSGDLLPEHGDFVSTMLRLARGGVNPDVVDDQTGSPTFVVDLARALWAIAAGGPLGTVHLAGAGRTSWWGLAREVFAAAGHDPGRVHPVPTAGYPTRAKRPEFSVLASDRPLPGWRDGVARAVAARL